MRVATKVVLDEQGVRNMVAKEAGISRAELDKELKSPRALRAASDLLLQGMKTTFILEGKKDVYTHSVGLDISMIVMEDTLNAAKVIEEIPTEVLELLISVEAVIEGSEEYNHLVWTAENVYEKLV